MELEKKGTMSEWLSTGLFEFSHHMIYQPSTLSLIGDIDPGSLEKDFCLFDKNFHNFLFPLPHWFYSWFLSREIQARTRLNKSWLKNRDPRNPSKLHQARLTLLDNHSDWLTNGDYGAFLTAFLWVSLGNTIPGVFWSLFYILQDTKALETIRQEINTHLPHFPLYLDSNDSSIEDWTPEQLDACVYLESAINETLRLVGAPFMTRKCIRPTEINLQDGRTITVKTGENLAWFGAAGHYDENLFPQPRNFVFDRFLNKKADNVVGYMPFGAGKSMCPGRFFAKYEIKTCLAMLLRYMDYKLPDTETIPSPKRARVGFGIAPPNKDVPILYRFRA